MSQVSAVLQKNEQGYIHFCPGCELPHQINVGSSSGPNWSFDGNLVAPTFDPSVRITYNGTDAGEIREGSGRRAPAGCCHYFIRAGRIEFCSDSTHALAGQVVPLPALPGWLLDF